MCAEQCVSSLQFPQSYIMGFTRGKNTDHTWFCDMTSQQL